jgi:hypothetical protein
MSINSVAQSIKLNADMPSHEQKPVMSTPLRRQQKGALKQFLPLSAPSYDHCITRINLHDLNCAPHVIHSPSATLDRLTEPPPSVGARGYAHSFHPSPSATLDRLTEPLPSVGARGHAHSFHPSPSATLDRLTEPLPSVGARGYAHSFHPSPSATLDRLTEPLPSVGARGYAHSFEKAVSPLPSVGARGCARTHVIPPRPPVDDGRTETLSPFPSVGAQGCAHPHVLPTLPHVEDGRAELVSPPPSLKAAGACALQFNIDANTMCRTATQSPRHPTELPPPASAPLRGSPPLHRPSEELKRRLLPWTKRSTASPSPSPADAPAGRAASTRPGTSAPSALALSTAPAPALPKGRSSDHITSTHNATHQNVLNCVNRGTVLPTVGWEQLFRPVFVQNKAPLTTDAPTSLCLASALSSSVWYSRKLLAPAQWFALESTRHLRPNPTTFQPMVTGQLYVMVGDKIGTAASWEDASSSHWPQPSDRLSLPPLIQIAAKRLFDSVVTIDSVALERLAAGYIDVAFCLRVLRHGARLTDARTIASLKPFHAPPPKPSEFDAKLREKFQKELGSGHLLLNTGEPSSFIHPVHANWKDPDKLEVRELHNMSWPYGRSVNDSLRFVSFSTTKFYDVCRSLTPNCWVARGDVKEYYRNFPIDPADWHLNAWRFDIYGDGVLSELHDLCVAFGTRNSVEIGHRFSCCIAYILNSRGVECVFVIMDDFLFVAQTRQQCQLAYDTFIEVCGLLRLPLNMKIEKTHPPARLCTWYGIVWDTQRSIAYLPTRKASKYRALVSPIIQSFARKGATRPPSITVERLQSLVGCLTHASLVLYGGKNHCRSLYKSFPQLDSMAIPHHHVSLPHTLLSDLLWWERVLQNPHLHPIQTGTITPSMWASTDAIGDGDIGIFSDTLIPQHFKAVHYSLSDLATLFHDAPEHGSDIADYESYAVVICARILACVWENQCIGLIVDNPTTAYTFSKLAGSPHSSAFQQYCATQVLQLSITHNFRLVWVEHVPGSLNQLADALSRKDFHRYQALVANHVSYTRPL